MAGHEPFNSGKDFDFVSSLDEKYQVDATAQEITTHEAEHVLKIPVIQYYLELLPSGEFGMYGKAMKDMVDVNEPGGKESLESLQTIAKRFSEDPAVLTATFHSRDIGYGRDYIYVFENVGNGKISALAIEYNGSEEGRANLQKLIASKEKNVLQTFDNLYTPVFLSEYLELDDFVKFVDQSYINQDQNESQLVYQARLSDFVSNETQEFERQMSRLNSRIESLNIRLKDIQKKQEIERVIKDEMEEYVRGNSNDFKIKNQRLTDPTGEEQFIVNSFKSINNVGNHRVIQQSPDHDTGIDSNKDLTLLHKKETNQVGIFDKVNKKFNRKVDYELADSTDSQSGLQNNLLARLQSKFRPIKENPGKSETLVLGVKTKEYKDHQAVESSTSQLKLTKDAEFLLKDLGIYNQVLKLLERKSNEHLSDGLSANHQVAGFLNESGPANLTISKLLDLLNKTNIEKLLSISSQDLLNTLIHKLSIGKVDESVLKENPLNGGVKEQVRTKQKQILNQLWKLYFPEILGSFSAEVDQIPSLIFKKIKPLIIQLFDKKPSEILTTLNLEITQVLFENLKNHLAEIPDDLQKNPSTQVNLFLQRLMETNEFRGQEQKIVYHLLSVLKILQEYKGLVLKQNNLIIKKDDLYPNRDTDELLVWHMLSIVLYLARLREHGISKHPRVKTNKHTIQTHKPTKINDAAIIYVNNSSRCGIITI